MDDVVMPRKQLGGFRADRYNFAPLGAAFKAVLPMDLGSSLMTTTVYDKAQSMVACDSRWSIPGDFGVLYVDEAPFQKIEVFRDRVFVFAGRAPVIDLWKKYLRAASNGLNVPQPSLEGIALLIAETGTGALVDSYQQDIMLPDPMSPETVFAGTGSTHAARCWIANKCPKRAVESAMNYDVYSGGEVRFLELLTGNSNLIECQGIESLGQAFIEKGMVMFTRNDQEKGPIPFKDAAAMDPAVAELYHGKAANGSLIQDVQAPCDGVFNKPLPEDEMRISETLRKIFN